MPVHIIRKMVPNPANTDANTAPTTSLASDLCSFGLFTRYLEIRVIEGLHDEPGEDHESDE